MIKAGFIQFEAKLGQQDANIQRLTSLLKDAADSNLIVIPELANSGYNFRSKEEAFSFSEEIHRSVYIDFLCMKAREHNLFIVSGINEREGNKLYNSAVLVGPTGLIGKYRKIHLFFNEFDIFEPGNLGLPVFDIGICKTGILICFDWIFPEVWRILALKGADVICHPSNLVLPYAQQAVPVQGMLNRTFTVTSNRIGTEKNLTFTGKSIIADPLGKTLLTASSDKEEVGFVEFDLSMARNKMITPRNHLFDDRIPRLYSDLIK